MSGSRPGASDTAQSSAWQRLWDSGAADSFGQSVGEPPASAHWTQWFVGLPAGASVLDLACGSGALLRRFLAANHDAGSRCHGVDLVSQGPVWIETLESMQRSRVGFTGGVSVTQLPFEAAQFDAVVSQFGIEYADLSLAVPEALRVLRRGGRLGWLMHHQESRPATLARVELGHAKWLLGSGWLEAASQMCRAMVLTSHDAGRHELSTSAEWANVRHRYDLLTQELQTQASNSACPDLLLDAQLWMTQAFRVSASQGTQAGQRAAQEVGAIITDTELRLGDMLAHTQSAADIEKTVSMLKGCGGGPVSVSTLQDRGHLLGWWVQYG